MTQETKVTQADREAVADYYQEHGANRLFCGRIRAGDLDSDPMLIAFARHRLASTEAADALLREAGAFPRIVSHEAARQAAQNFIDQHFHNKGGKGVLTSIPAKANDDDVTLTDYIKQQEALAQEDKQ